jgi:AcrR family transcriptional regulator
VARTVDVESYSAKRVAFVDAGQRLIQAKGYDALSINDVLAEVGASKGAFYHYFGSKGDLLEAVIDRMADGIEVAWHAMLEQPGRTADERLHDVFAVTAQWKGARRELVLAVLEGWLSDRNAIVREKLRALVRRRLRPTLVRIIRQGIEEGVFTATDPEGTADVVITMILGGQEEATELFIARQAGRVTFEDVVRHFEAYDEALTRVLGVRPGRLSLTDPPTLQTWFG